MESCEVKVNGMEWRGERLFITGDYSRELEIYRGFELRTDKKKFLKAIKRRRRDYLEELKNYKRYIHQYSELDSLLSFLIIGGLCLISDGFNLLGDIDPILPAYIQSTVGCILTFTGAIGRYFTAFDKIYHHPKNRYLKGLAEIEDRERGKTVMGLAPWWR